MNMHGQNGVNRHKRQQQQNIGQGLPHTTPHALKIAADSTPRSAYLHVDQCQETVE